MIDWSCANCGCVQWMPKTFNDQLRISHKSFYCLNGHGNYYYKKTNIEQVEDKLMNEYAKNAQLESQINDLKAENSKLKKSFVNRIFKP